MAKFDKVIPPGQEGTIHLQIQGNAVTGRFSKTAVVYTNDPKHPKMTLRLSGTIKPYVLVEPATRIMLRGTYGEKVEREISISSNEDKPFEITRVESNIDDKITYKVLPHEEDGKFRIKIWKNPKLPVMNTYGNLFIYTNSENAPKKVLQVQVLTKSEYTVHPNALNFGSVVASLEHGDSPLERSVTISKYRGEFEIKDISFSDTSFRAKVEELVAGRKYKVTVDFFPAPEKKRYMGEMIIRTDDPREPSLTVRLFARAM